MSQDTGKDKALSDGMDRRFAEEVSAIINSLRNHCKQREMFFVCAFMSKKGETITSGAGTYESHLVLVQALMDAMEQRAQAQEQSKAAVSA